MRPSRSKFSLPPVELARQSVDHHVAGAGIEGDDIFGRAAGGITVILAMPPILSATRVRARMAEQQVIDEGHQRRALAAGGDIARAEIGDHGDAGALGDHGRFADLQRVGAPPS